jgi:hypothetical protein
MCSYTDLYINIHIQEYVCKYIYINRKKNMDKHLYINVQLCTKMKKIPVFLEPSTPCDCANVITLSAHSIIFPKQLMMGLNIYVNMDMTLQIFPYVSIHNNINSTNDTKLLPLLL